MPGAGRNGAVFITTPKKNLREDAVCKAARDELHVELAMEHRESEHRVTVVQLRRALELAYDLGRRSALS
jgi:hypothetical protein